MVPENQSKGKKNIYTQQALINRNHAIITQVNKTNYPISHKSTY